MKDRLAGGPGKEQELNPPVNDLRVCRLTPASVRVCDSALGLGDSSAHRVRLQARPAPQPNPCQSRDRCGRSCEE